MSKVTIVIGTYKRPHQIIKSIDSILNQTFYDFMLFVVDDNHTDDNDIIRETRQNIDTFQDSRIKYVKNPYNIGVPFVYRKWINLVESPYFIVFGDGDTLKPDALEKMVNFLEANPRASFVHGLETFEDENGNLLRKDIPLFTFTKLVSAKTYLNGTLTFSGIGWSQACALYRTEFFRVKNIPIVHEHYWDYYFHCKYLLFSTEVGYINEYIAVRHIEPGLNDWAKNNYFVNNIERIYQALRFINEHEAYMLPLNYHVNKLRIVLLIKLFKHILAVPGREETLFALNLFLNNFTPLFISYFSFFLLFPFKFLVRIISRVLSKNIA